MTTFKQNRRHLLIALMFIIGAILFAGTTVYAAAESPPDTPLTIREVWLTGDTLHISVADGGEGQKFELNLRTYAMPGDEYVTIQATDESGRTSNSITFKNPYYVQNAEPPANSSGNTEGNQSESAVPSGLNPFTPDGTGTVVDNAMSGDGKEFFTVSTEDGNTFYLIVDRQRNTDNVYLLNAVTEHDLMSLAKPGDGMNVSAIPQPPVATPTTPEPPAMPEPTPAPAPSQSGGNTGMLAFIGIAALVFGAAAYYFKIVRPKKDGAVSDFEPDDFEDEEFDVSDDGEDGDDE